MKNKINMHKSFAALKATRKIPFLTNRLRGGAYLPPPSPDFHPLWCPLVCRPWRNRRGKVLSPSMGKPLEIIHLPIRKLFQGVVLKGCARKLSFILVYREEKRLQDTALHQCLVISILRHSNVPWKNLGNILNCKEPLKYV